MKVDILDYADQKRFSTNWNTINGVSNGKGKVRHHDVEYCPCVRLSPQEYEKRKRMEGNA